MVIKLEKQSGVEKLLNRFSDKSYKLIWNKRNDKIIHFGQRIGISEFDDKVYGYAVGSREELRFIVLEKKLIY